MRNRINKLSFFAGMLTMALLFTLILPSGAAGVLSTLRDVKVGGIRIVIDGQELHPTDTKGNPVEAMIYNGTTYLPVRAIATALNKAVSWDGPTYTVYLGDMDGKLEYPTVMLQDLVSIMDSPAGTDSLTDNYGNRYGSAILNETSFYVTSLKFEYLLNMKYSRFRGTLYIPEGESSNYKGYLTMIADGRTIYTSPEMTKTSPPVSVDVDVTGYNDIQISFSTSDNYVRLCLADAGFYQ